MQIDLPNNYGKRYLELNNFIDLCKSLDLDCSYEWLEDLHKWGILFPDYTIELPIRYTKSWRKYRTGLLSYGDLIKKPDHYLKFHPIDHKERIIPATYSKWEYRTKQRHDRFIHYYHYWKAYLLFDINIACTLKYFVNAFDKETVKTFWEKGIKKSLIKKYQIPSYNDYLRDEFGKYQKYYNGFSVYNESYGNLNNCSLAEFVQRSKWTREEREKSEAIIAGQRFRIFQICNKSFNFTVDGVYQYLEYLITKYFEYINENMHKLAYANRKEIENLVEVFQIIYGLSIEEINEKIKRVPTTPIRNPLNIILFGKVAQAKENLENCLKEIISRNFKHIKIPISLMNINKFIKFCDKHSLQIIYMDINEYYFKKDSLLDVKKNLLSLAMHYELYLKAILKENRIIKERKNIKEMLNLIYNIEEDVWLKVVNGLWNNYKIENHNYTRHLNLEEEKIEIAEMFLFAKETRNILAHSGPIPILKNYYFNYGDKIIGAIWFTWNYAMANNKEENL